jgi:hypothetical protein
MKTLLSWKLLFLPAVFLLFSTLMYFSLAEQSEASVGPNNIHDYVKIEQLEERHIESNLDKSRFFAVRVKSDLPIGCLANLRARSCGCTTVYRKSGEQHLDFSEHPDAEMPAGGELELVVRIRPQNDQQSMPLTTSIVLFLNNKEHDFGIEVPVKIDIPVPAKTP